MLWEVRACPAALDKLETASAVVRATSLQSATHTSAVIDYEGRLRVHRAELCSEGVDGF